tara:strand:- start:1555 stop:1803 length:249 start_codon:yes stop_codon:yes gene_type:complete
MSEQSIWFKGKDHLLHEMDLEELRECAYNAAATGCRCGGHYKAERNEANFHLFNMELRKRNEPELDYFDVAEKGSFNGKGSF